MKISLNWLSDYIELNDYRNKLDELSELLTKAGLEVEDMENPAQHWDNIVVGHLLEVGKHPDADKLTLCKVDVGGDEPKQIVCGAKNHKQGDKVVVAQVGAVLPGDFKIKKSKIRGVESFGMLCSTSELGLSGDADGILLLDQSAPTGQAFSEYYKDADIVFELNVTPNRADCLSHMGLARELSTLLDRPIKKPEAAISEKGKNVNDFMKVELKDSEACPRFCGRMITGVKVKESPQWMKDRLEAVGVNSINNIVDITNYVLFEYGQPLHAYDYAKVNGQTIKVDKDKAGEKFTSLDGTEFELTDHDLMIKDANGNVGMAGVVGGQNSGVSDDTKDIFLEAAFFRAEGVRRSSRFHGIETDAGYRFSRGVDPENTLDAMNRAAALFQDLGEGEIQKGHVDLYPQPLVHNQISIETSYVSERLGYSVSDEDFASWMKRLNCAVEKSGSEFKVTPPAYRWDLSIPEDLVEEYGRLHGYDQIQEVLPTLNDEPTNHVFEFDFTNKVSQLLSVLGVYQTVNYAFIGEKLSEEVWGDRASLCGMNVCKEAIVLKNPISEELKVMRESLLPSLLKNLVHNDHHGNHWGRLFEIAPTHFKQGDQYGEEQRLAMVFWGKPEGLWESKKENEVLFQLKSVVEAMLIKIGAKNWRWDQLTPEKCPPGFHPGQSATLFYEGKVIGIFGTLHPEIKSKHKIRSQVAWAEFNFENLGARQPRSPKFKSLPKFPSVERDIAFLAEETIPADKMGAEIKRAAGPLLETYEVFDVYQDKDLKAAGKRSVAFRLHFQSDKETLKDEQVNQLRDKVVDSLSKKLGLEIR
ncbi:MAG: phenylalanine--tRNA ligase subunit beta [Bdellovibrionales bacterium]|nr:phenylalanine--tRNA ligase subunit beta [Bdellovibrionales bacterium]NQZ19024.1 phenylalanine--tRNA ligase subunit beta [Bdellovibrionales bacterium]